ncbi:hypothetical protein [Acidithiobacillus ferriphilus]|uniref:hypothetical protein n=1 Tax=Acidithiobacillus ferriphilus TaxID=1689834 RepID=UPI00242C41E0|nr:hypothetical protein [Acidithiobacillus ferriphilus]MBW9254363.1 hypothetical protein [Acidithiobacillus ferriphilus]
MTGQRGGGHRAPPRYGRVRSDGGIEWMSKAKAYRAWQEARGAAGPSNRLAEFDTELLLEEIRRRGVVSCASCSQRGSPSPS